METSIPFEIKLRIDITNFNKEAERIFKRFTHAFPPRCFLTHWYYYQLTRPSGLVCDDASRKELTRPSGLVSLKGPISDIHLSEREASDEERSHVSLKGPVDVFIRDITSERSKELLKELTIIAMRKDADETIASKITSAIIAAAKKYLSIRKSTVSEVHQSSTPIRGFKLTKFNDDEQHLELLENRSICFTCGDTIAKVRITKALERKLRMMYDAHNEHTSDSDFLIRAFCMLYRYETLNTIAKETMQLSAPDNDYAQKEKDGYTLECFASPINSHLERFCSGFYDVDKYFGSVGSFFEVGPIVLKDCSIKATCDTPYQLDAIELNVDIVLEALKQEEYEKEFHFILPYWPDAEYVTKLKDSKYTKSYVVDEAYTYVLHSTESESKKSIVPCATLRCLLNNFE